LGGAGDVAVAGGWQGKSTAERAEHAEVKILGRAFADVKTMDEVMGMK
jgi:hypothetical protein